MPKHETPPTAVTGEPLRERERQERFKDLVIYTSTLYRGDDEQTRLRKDLAQRFFENADALGVSTIVVDSGSDAEFLEGVRQYPHVSIIPDDPKNISMGASRRHALAKALMNQNAEHFLWSEPEKYGLITDGNLEALLQNLRAGEADVVVPKRKEATAMPKFQRWEEMRVNKRISETLDVKGEDENRLDLFFGPKIFNRRGAEHFLKYNEAGDKKDLWDAIITPVAHAKKAGQKVASVEVDYQYDPREVELEERMGRTMKEKRVTQYKRVLGSLDDPFWKNKQ